MDVHGILFAVVAVAAVLTASALLRHQANRSRACGRSCARASPKRSIYHRAPAPYEVPEAAFMLEAEGLCVVDAGHVPDDMGRDVTAEPCAPKSRVVKVGFRAR